MKLYYHPVSTTSRPVLLFLAEHGVEAEQQVVDLMKGEHLGDSYRAINPSMMVPMLEDGDFRLTESSAILKYLGDKYDAPSYPREPRIRAQINERMDWLNTGLYRDLGYNFIYPQIFPHHRRPDPAGQAATLDWGRQKSKHWLGILDRELIGPTRKTLCGDQITIADYFGAGMLTVGEVIRLDYAGYPNITRWLEHVKSLPGWGKTNEVFYAHFVGAYKDAPFEAL